MASIHVKGNKHYVVVSRKNPISGKFEPDWIPFDTVEQAENFRDNIEDEKRSAEEREKSITNATRTLEELIWEYVNLVGRAKWGLKTYPTYVARINNYIIPLIDGMKVWECSTLRMDEFFMRLQQTHAYKTNKKLSNKLVSAKVVDEIHKFMKAMFNCAIEWGYLDKNPCQKANRTIIAYKSKKRTFWTDEEYARACELCIEAEDYLLLTAMILAVGTTTREGEILGLEWDRCYISDERIKSYKAGVFIDRTLARVEKYMLNQRPQDVLKVFPDLIKSSKSSLVLKIPKSDTSNRSICLQETTARFLQLHKRQQNEQKTFLGNAYQDHNLVFALDDGRPMENKVLYNRFVRFVESTDLPTVVFHSLRNTSTTYKLITYEGDIKSLQGEIGHAQAHLITDVYAGIVTGKKQEMYAQKFNDGFLNIPALKDVLERFGCNGESSHTQGSAHNEDEAVKILSMLQANPLLAQQIYSLAQAQTV